MKAILNNNTIELIFPYNINIINKVKQIPGRTWNPFPINRWIVPYNQNSITSLIDIGFNMKEIVSKYNELLEKIQSKQKELSKDIKEEFPFLYDYQIEAVVKGINNKKLYLADTMGLGKTLESLSIVEHFMNNKTINKTFVLCPASITQQWKTETERFNNNYKIITSKNKSSDRKRLYKTNDRIITTYDLVANDFITVQPLINNQGLILDEATRIKNPSTRRHKAISQLTPKIAVYNSGTPFETKLKDVWNVANTLNPQWMTKREYYGYCDYDPDPRLQYPKLLGYKNLTQFANRFNEIGIKREFKDVCSEAPIMTHYNHIIPQNKEQETLQSFIKERTKDDFIASATLLQMLSSHPSLLINTKSRLMQDIITDYKLSKSLTKSTSPKLSYLQTLLEEHDDNKIVIFSRFINMRDKLYKSLSKTHKIYTIETIISFKKLNQTKGILILGDSSIYGVDIPEASMLINFDILWNPAQMEQRNARIHRISSKHNIKIINLISEGIEQYMFDYNQQCKKDGIQALETLKSFIKFIKL